MLDLELKDFITYRIFPNREVASDTTDILDKAGITYFIEEDAVNFDPSYANNELNKDFCLKIHPSSFKLADKAIEEFYVSQIDHIPSDYYLFEFSDAELIEILEKPDEWGSLDYILAKQLLLKRGVEIHPVQTEDLKRKRLVELSKQETVGKGTLIAGYLFSIFLFPVGIIMGWNWTYGKKTLPDGSRIHSYNDSVRFHGKAVFFIGIGLMIISTLIRLSKIY